MQRTMLAFRRTALLAATLPLAYSASTQLSKYNEKSPPNKPVVKIPQTQIHEPIKPSIQQKKLSLWQQREDRLFNKLLSLALDTKDEYKWNEIKTENNDNSNNKDPNHAKHHYTMHKINDDEDEEIRFIKSECIVNNFSPFEYFQFLSNANNFCKWEVKYVEPCTKTDNLRIIDKDHCILYGVYKAIPDSFYSYFNIISPRDFQYILSRKYLKNKNENNKDICINFMYSIDNKHGLYINDVDNENKLNGYVRSEFMGMYIVQKMDDDDKCKLITILCGDAKGWIPSWLNNQITLHTVDMIQKFKHSIPWMKGVINEDIHMEE